MVTGASQGIGAALVRAYRDRNYRVIATSRSVEAEEKTAIIKGVSQVLLDVLNKPLESTYVVIEEVDLDNWGCGGLPTAQYRKLRAAR
ncbi:tautomerase family protein [Pararhizobium sp. YC-54]|uniref:tautomerase family protein n=1 Tax=Pararhizobium sp. YC-54 TaxID=2986920 RepID=UPI0021F6A23B|nr:tautomerase family protein [Pararhizobium sp. YC-54]MCW0000753.1 tautomerase family protein [Pararhizobium sp. YC-54]